MSKGRLSTLMSCVVDIVKPRETWALNGQVEAEFFMIFL